MIKEVIVEKYLRALLKGDRAKCREAIEEAMKNGTPAGSVYLDIIWPIMLEIEQLLKADKISRVAEHLATRINRTIVDQLQNKLPRQPKRDKKLVICCAEDEQQELGAQIMADIFESDGWEVRFLGGGLNNDDIFAYVNNSAPDMLLIYGTHAKQAPGIRTLIDTIKGVNAWPNMRIMVSGGLFNRAEGLWEEIGADLYAADAAQAIQVAVDENPIQPVQTINKRKKKRRKLSGT